MFHKSVHLFIRLGHHHRVSPKFAKLFSRVSETEGNWRIRAGEITISVTIAVLIRVKFAVSFASCSQLTATSQPVTVFWINSPLPRMYINTRRTLAIGQTDPFDESYLHGSRRLFPLCWKSISNQLPVLPRSPRVLCRWPACARKPRPKYPARWEISSIFRPISRYSSVHALLVCFIFIVLDKLI